MSIEVIEVPKLSIQSQNTNLQSSRLQNSNNQLRAFLDASSECEYIKKRLKMLQIVESHNQAKIKQNQMSLQKIKNMRTLKQDKKQQRKMIMQKRKQAEEQRRVKNKQNKGKIKNHIEDILKQIQLEKSQDRSRIREQSKNIKEKIQQLKQKDLDQKREKRNKVLQTQHQSKQNYKIYLVQKKDDQIKKNQLQTLEYQKKKQEKKRQIKKMAKTEIQLLQRQSQVVKQFDTVKTKLCQIYRVKKGKATFHNYKSFKQNNIGTSSTHVPAQI